MINLFIDSDKRLWVVDKDGRLRRDAGGYLLYFGENEFEEIELGCVSNIHGNIIRHYDTSLVVMSDEDHTYPVSFTSSDEGLVSDPIPIDASMTSRAGEIAVYVRFTYQDRVVGRTNSVHFMIRSGVCGEPRLPSTLRVTPKPAPQEYSSPAGYDRVEVAAVQAEELTVVPGDARQVFLPSENRYYDKVTVERPDLSLQDIDVAPSREEQYLTADDDHFAIRSVRVEPIPSALDLQIKRAEPSVREQTVTADGEYVGLSEVRLTPVTAAIDRNIDPLNIRRDVEILGVRGEMDPIEITVEDEEDDPCLAYLYDYDGTPIATYTADELEELESLPTPPAHSGLTFLRYNRTKASMIEYLTVEHTSVSAGALYDVVDGHTRMTVTPDLNDLSAQITMSFEQARLNIDWGDGSTQTVTELSAVRTLSHTYPRQGEYVIDMELITGAVYLGHRSGSMALTTQKSLIRSVFIGGNFTIPDRAFYDCCVLRTVVLPKTLAALPVNCFGSCRALRFLVLPDAVVSVGDNAFNTCSSLREIVFPDAVTSVAAYAFRNCSALERAVLCRGVTSVGNNAFESCYRMRSAYLGESLTAINEYLFSECRRLVSVKVPQTVTAIGRYAFNICSSLKKISLSAGLLTIGDRAFYNTGLRSVSLPGTLTSIGSNAFAECRALREMAIPSSTTSLGTSVFQNCTGLRNVSTGGVQTIPNNAFSSCMALSEVTLGESTQRIGSGAFTSCRALNRLNLPESVSRVDANFVNGCDSLTELDLSRHIVPPNATDSSFSGAPEYMYVYVRDEAKRALFASAAGWSSISHRIFVRPTP